MSQFPQNGGWGQAPQGWNQQGGVPMQQQQQWGGQQQQQPQWNPQASGFVQGPPYQDGEFPDENVVTMTGQVYPNQFSQQGWEFRPTQQGGMVTINVKLRSPGYKGNQPRISYIKVVAWGDLANQLKNELQPGRLIKFTGQWQEGGYKSKRDGKNKKVNQIVLKPINGQVPYQLGGVLRLINETPPAQNGGGQWGGQQQQWGGQQSFPQQAPQGFPQGGPAQTLPQAQPPQQQWGPPQAQPQQQAPQQQWGPPAQQSQPAMPQGGAFPQGGGFAPPQAAPPQLPPAAPTPFPTM